MKQAGLTLYNTREEATSMGWTHLYYLEIFIDRATDAIRSNRERSKEVERRIQFWRKCRRELRAVLKAVRKQP